jgi:hypothetical protein
VVLSVVDNGPGIPREPLPRSSTGSGRDQGRGPGWAGISATIVRDHGGQIWAESEEGRGAAFFVQLPRAPRASARRPEEPARARRPPGGARAARPDRRRRASLRLALSLFLQRRGHQVVQAADAYEALRLAQEHEFDVALVDARMPGDGLRLLEKLEAMPALQGRTALMTGDLGRMPGRQPGDHHRPPLPREAVRHGRGGAGADGAGGRRAARAGRRSGGGVPSFPPRCAAPGAGGRRGGVTAEGTRDV